MDTKASLTQVKDSIRAVEEKICRAKELEANQTEERRSALVALNDEAVISAESQISAARSTIERGEEQLQLLRQRQQELEAELEREQKAAETRRLQAIHDEVLVPLLRDYDKHAPAVAELARKIFAVDAYLCYHGGPNFESTLRHRQEQKIEAVYEEREVERQDWNGVARILNERGEDTARPPTPPRRYRVKEQVCVRPEQILIRGASLPYFSQLHLPRAMLDDGRADDVKELFGDGDRRDAERHADEIVHALLQSAPKKAAKAA